MEGESGDAKLALIKDVQHDPLTGNILHVDFHAVQADEAISAQVPVILEGEAIGVTHGGLLDHMIHSLEVSCLPRHLPEVLTLDISGLEVGDNAFVADVHWPDGVEPTMSTDVLVAQVRRNPRRQIRGRRG